MLWSKLGPCAVSTEPALHNKRSHCNKKGNPVRNHLCIKQQPRWKDQEEDEKEKPGRKKATELRIRDLEDDLEMSSYDSKASGEEHGWGPKVKKKGPPSKGGWKKKKGSDDEAFEVSDNGDFKGQEVDYMSASRSNSQEELEGKPIHSMYSLHIILQQTFLLIQLWI